MKICFSEKINKYNKYIYKTYEEKEDTNCEYQGWKRGHHNRSYRYLKENKDMLWTNLCSLDKLDEMDKFPSNR